MRSANATADLETHRVNGSLIRPAARPRGGQIIPGHQFARNFLGELAEDSADELRAVAADIAATHPAQAS